MDVGGCAAGARLYGRSAAVMCCLGGFWADSYQLETDFITQKFEKLAGWHQRIDKHHTSSFWSSQRLIQQELKWHSLGLLNEVAD
jgi:hypothetical protein